MQKIYVTLATAFQKEDKDLCPGGLSLTAGPLSQDYLALQKPIKIWDLSKQTVIGGLLLMPGPREPELYCMFFDVQFFFLVAWLHFSFFLLFFAFLASAPKGDKVL